MLVDFFDHTPEIAKLPGTMLAPRALQVVEKAFHGLKTGGVERLEDVEGGEEEGAGAAGGVENGDGGESLPEGAHQFRPFTIGDDVLGELFDVEVVGDEVVDRCDLAGLQLGVDLLVAAAAGDVLAPGLGGEGVCVRGRLVPAAALGDVVKASGDSRGQRLFCVQFLVVVGVVGNAVADGLVEVAVGVILEQLPDTVGTEGDGALLFGAVKEEGDDGVAADVAGDVLLGVVGAHLLLLVDVFFEDVTEYVGVDLVVVAQRAVVEMPLVGVEEGEDLFECFVGNGNVRVVVLEIVDVEKAAVEVGDLTEFCHQFRVTFGLGHTQPLVKQPQQKETVKAVEPLGAVPLAHNVEAVTQVVAVVVEKAAFLDEIDEHHAIEHQRGVPFAVGHFLDTLNEAEKVLMLILETVIESLGYFLDVEGSEHVASDVYDREVGLIFEGEDNPFQLLDEGFSALVGSVDMGARAVRACPVHV